MVPKPGPYAARHGFTRHQQDAYARDSHARAVRAMAARSACTPSAILPLEGLLHDAYPRLLTERQASRMPVAARAPTDTHSPDASDPDCALSRLAISPQADGAALVLMASAEFCARHGIAPAAHWLGGLSLGADPDNPLTSALAATEALMQRQQLDLHVLHAVELHDAFAVQGLAFQEALQSQGLDPARVNAWGGGLARGHPIGASGAIALVELLARLHATRPSPCANSTTSSMPERPEHSEMPAAPSSAPHRDRPDMQAMKTASTPRHSRLGLACIAGVGGLGSAALVAAHQQKVPSAGP